MLYVTYTVSATGLVRRGSWAATCSWAGRWGGSRRLRRRGAWPGRPDTRRAGAGAACRGLQAAWQASQGWHTHPAGDGEDRHAGHNARPRPRAPPHVPSSRHRVRSRNSGAGLGCRAHSRGSLPCAHRPGLRAPRWRYDTIAQSSKRIASQIGAGALRASGQLPLSTVRSWGLDQGQCEAGRVGFQPCSPPSRRSCASRAASAVALCTRAPHCLPECILHRGRVEEEGRECWKPAPRCLQSLKVPAC